MINLYYSLPRQQQTQYKKQTKIKRKTKINYVRYNKSQVIHHTTVYLSFYTSLVSLYTLCLSVCLYGAGAGAGAAAASCLISNEFH